MPIVPGAPLDRPAKSTPLRSFAGDIAAEPDRVFAALLRRVAPSSPEGGHLSTDPVRRLIVVQGGWWYRGEWRILPDDAGCRIEYEIVNVADPAHWAGPLTGRKELKAAPGEFAALVEELRLELA